jgi:hypothetical protein
MPLLFSLLSCVSLSWLLGAAVAEFWALADEARLKEATLWYNPQSGYWAND